MKKNLLRCAFFISIIFLCSPTAASEETYLFKFEPPNKHCPHGLHQQPNGGPYSVYVFCDDAGGTNIGIILTEPGPYDRKSYEHGSVIKSVDLNKKGIKISTWLYDHKLKKVVEFEKEIPLE
ncbi:MAG: hypothetical protein PVF79_17100 [Desulfobacterales bacterium]|jgi:hypothetical protein